MPDEVTAPVLQDRRGRGLEKQLGPCRDPSPLLTQCMGSTRPPPDTPPCPPPPSGTATVTHPRKVRQVRKNTRLTASQFLFIYFFCSFFFFFFLSMEAQV